MKLETEEVTPVVNNMKPLLGTAVSIRGAEYAGRALACDGAWARNQQPAFTSPAFGRGRGVAPAMTAAAGVAGTTTRRVIDPSAHAVGTKALASTDLDLRGRPRWRPV